MAPLAMVTGASSGIGRAYAERLGADGSDLVLVARRADRLTELARDLQAAHGTTVRTRAADLADRGDVDRLCAELAEEPPDLLVNNAGLAHYKPFVELPPEEARQLVDVNALAPILLTRAVLPGMTARRAGAVVNVASLLAFSESLGSGMLPQRAVYAATKSFLVTFSRILAAELAGTGVRVQVVCPGVVRSEFHSRQGLDLSATQRMEPELVVAASLADLARDVVVSVPGLAEEAAVDRYDAASAALTAAARATELPDRYPPPQPAAPPDADAGRD